MRANVDDATLHGTVLATRDAIAEGIDGRVRRIRRFDVDAVAAFLEATTAESAYDLSDTVPTSVPSGLPIDR